MYMASTCTALTFIIAQMFCNHSETDINHKTNII